MLVNDFEVDMVGKNGSVNWKKKNPKYGTRTEIVSRIQLGCLRQENESKMCLIDLSFRKIKVLISDILILSHP